MSRRGVGRPTKFTPETRNSLIQALSTGVSVKAACAMARINTSTFYLWCNIGEAVATGGDHELMPSTGPKQQEYLDFSIDVKRAQALQQARAVSNVIKAGVERWEHIKTGVIRQAPPPPITWVNKRTGEIVFDNPHDEDEWIQEWSGEAWSYKPGQWQADAWFLERTDFENWGRKNLHEVSGRQGGAIPVELTWRAVVEAAKREGNDDDA